MSTLQASSDRLISFVLPVYNEEKSLPALHGQIVAAMERQGARFEMVGDYHQRTGGREATFNLGKSVFLTVGASYAF